MYIPIPFFYLRYEGYPIRNGFNFYPLDSDSLGGILRCGDFVFKVRYSKIQRRWFMGRRHRADIEVEALTCAHFPTQEEDETREAQESAQRALNRGMRMGSTATRED